MKPETHFLAAVALATLFSLASPRPDDRYRTRSNAAEGSSFESQQAARLRHAETRAARRKRGYPPWMRGQDQFGGLDNYPSWQPEIIGPAYIIPIYPSPFSTKRLYPFHRQPFNVNPGFPPDNPPKKPYRGPSYLPPRKPPSKPSPNATTTTEATNIADRFNFGDDDRPVWGDSEDAPASGVPTRPPPPPNMQDVPPLVHMAGMNPLSVDGKEVDEVFPPFSTQRPATATSTARRLTTTTAPRPAAPAAAAPPSGPSNCVWAVVSCCSAASIDVAETCFEQRGCPGPFWDNSPCDSEFARAAIASALNYYNQ